MSQFANPFMLSAWSERKDDSSGLTDKIMKPATNYTNFDEYFRGIHKIASGIFKVEEK